MTPENPSTGLITTSQSPALARVSNQLTLTNKLLAKPEEPFLIPYRKSDKWGFCDRNKNIAIDCIYDDVVSFRDGFAGGRVRNEFYFFEYSGSIVYHFVSDNLSYNFPLNWLSDKRWISDGIIIIQSMQKNHTHEFINIITGESKVFDEKIYKKYRLSPRIVGSFSSGLILLTDILDSCGFVNNLGQLAIPQIYQKASPFSNGLAAVSIDKSGWYLINSSNEKLGYLEYDIVHSPSEGLCVVSSAESKKSGYADLDGNLVIEMRHNKAGGFSSGLAKSNPNGSSWGYINKQGQFVISPQYELASDFIHGLAVVKKGNFFGVINTEGESITLLKYNYSAFSAFRTSVARVAIDVKGKPFEFYIDTKGNEYYEF